MGPIAKTVTYVTHNALKFEHTANSYSEERMNHWRLIGFWNVARDLHSHDTVGRNLLYKLEAAYRNNNAIRER